MLRPQPLRTLILRAALSLASGLAVLPLGAPAQQASTSAWGAADFRSWSFIPYWTSLSQVNSFATDRVYDHLSDVVYHSAKPHDPLGPMLR